MIELQDVTKRYRDSVVVDGVSIDLPRAGVTAIVGPNGAGKSTLLTMIGRLLPSSGGTILVDGLDVAQASTEAMARRLSILRQDNQIVARLSVRDLVSFGRYPYSKGRITREDAERIDEALVFLDLVPISDRFLDEVSGGQRQRAYVAMVLCQGTDYVLLDEPLNSLDIGHARRMLTRLRRMATELGRAVVVVLHDLNFASCYADRIVAMREGRVLHQGTVAEMMTRQVMSDVYGVDMDILEVGGDRIAIYYR